MRSSDDIKAFYDQFARSRMATYRHGSNLRIELAARRAIEHVEPDSRILEIGCGTGLVTERLSANVPFGEVWACDISQEAIELASRGVEGSNTHLAVIDILDEAQTLIDWLDIEIDVVVMIDVIEHIPIDRHDELFRTIGNVMADHAKVVLTFPSPMYQQYLRQHNPDELQIIDEIVTVEHLVNLAQNHGLDIVYFSFHDVWMTNQYVHCVLEAAPGLIPLSSRPKSRLERAAHLPRRLARRGIGILARVGGRFAQ